MRSVEEKSRGEPNWVHECLDHGFANQGWRDMFNSAEVRVIEVATSDHLSLYLTPNKKVYIPKTRRFRFENGEGQSQEFNRKMLEC
ncbi:hypothetical protein AgCh_004267 [Apium graveolens]